MTLWSPPGPMAKDRLALRLGFCAGIDKPARVAFYGVDAEGGPDPALHFEAVAEFDSFKAAATAIRAARATVEAFWTRPRNDLPRQR